VELTPLVFLKEEGKPYCIPKRISQRSGLEGVSGGRKEVPLASPTSLGFRLKSRVLENHLWMPQFIAVLSLILIVSYVQLSLS